jgi:PAS domain S-box-containing protein
MKFATKLVLFFLGFFIIVSLFVLYSVTSSTRSMMEDEIEDKLEEQAFAAMDKIDRTLYQRQLTITNIRSESLSKLFALTDKPNPDQIQKNLEGIQSRNDFFSSLSFYAMNRINIADTNRLDVGKRHAQNEYWPEIEAGQENVFGMYFSDSRQQAVFHFATVVKGRNGKAAGVFVARIPGEHLNDIAIQAGGVHGIDQAMVASGLLKVDIVDKNGLLVYSNYNQKGILKENFGDWNLVRKELQSGNWLDSRRFVRPDGKDEIVAWTQELGYKEFKGNGWTLVTTLPAKIVLAPAEKLQNRLALILLIAGLISVIGIVLFSRTLSKPIEALDRATNEIRKGNLDFQLSVGSNDEVGRLAESFNSMSLELARSNASINEYAGQLKNVLQEREVILETAEVGIAHLVNRKPVWVNHYCQLIYGYSPKEVEAMPDVSTLYPSLEAYKDVGRLASPVMARGEAFIIEQMMRRKDGSIIWCKMVGKAVDPANHAKGVIWVMEDITERKRLENDLRLAKDQAEAATKLKDKFVSLVSHDLKSPLGTMIGFMKLLKNSPPLQSNDPHKRILDKTIDTGSQMVGLIDDLLAITRLKGGHLKLNKRFFDAKYLGLKMASDYSFVAKTKGIELENAIPENSRVYGDKTLMTEAVQNLVTNSIKFCVAGDRITISLAERSATTICVRDTGPGIRPEMVDKVLKYEERTSTIGTAGELGTGLGLPFVKDIMEFHGGGLELETEPGKGCLFRLKLPFVRPKILVVDDNAEARLLRKVMLEELNADILEAENGEDALKKTASERPHLIITDVKMPVMDGLELLERLKRDPGTMDIPVIVVTVEYGMEIRDKIFKLGADDLATKDKMDEIEFISRVRRFIG